MMRPAWTALVANQLTTENTREVVVDGKRWLVAPAAIIPHGVMSGSKGPLYYPAAESKRTAHLWDGIPITVQHPFDPATGQPLSANDAGVRDRQEVGVVRSPTHDGKTRAELWFDADATLRKSPETYHALKRDEKIPLSTGLYTDNVPTAGNFGGVPYVAAATNHRPDHLAVLPGGRGACHLDDGCGVNVTNSAMCNCGGVINAEGVCSGCGRDTGESGTKNAGWEGSSFGDWDSDNCSALSAKAYGTGLAKDHQAAADALNAAAALAIKAGDAKSYNALTRAAAEHLSAASLPQTKNVWSDEAREAAAAARKATSTAKTPGQHIAAAQLHMSAAVKASNDRDEKSAGEHQEQAEKHYKAAGAVSHNEWSDAARTASAAARAASRTANKTSDPADHAKAFRAHSDAELEHNATGDRGAAQEHSKAAAAHDKLSGPTTVLPKPTNGTIAGEGAGMTKVDKLLHRNEANPTWWQKFVSFISNAPLPARAPGGQFAGKGAAGAHAAAGMAAAHASGGGGQDDPNADADSDDAVDALGVPIKAPPKQKKVLGGETHNKQRTQEQLDRVPDWSFAGPDQSYPIETQQDLDNACQALGRAKDPEAVKASIRRIAERQGLKLPDTDTWKGSNTMNREQALNILTSNCTCEADRASLRNMSDGALLSLAANKDFTSDDERKAAFAHMNADEASSKADRASKTAERKGTTAAHDKASDAHTAAAKAHSATARATTGDTKKAHLDKVGEHQDKADYHDKQAEAAKNSWTGNAPPKKRKNKNVDTNDDDLDEEEDSEFDDDDDDDDVENQLHPRVLMATVNRMSKVEQLTRGVADPKKRERLVANLLMKSEAYLDELMELRGPVANANAAVQPFGMFPVFGAPAMVPGAQDATVDNERQVETTLDYAANASPALVARLKQQST